MKKAIIVSQSDYTTDMAQQALRNMGYSSISSTAAASEVRRIIQATPPDIIVIDAPLYGEFGTELAETAAEDTEAAVILLCSSDIADEIADRLSYYNILVLSKPLNCTTLEKGIQLLASDTIPFSSVRESEEVMQRISDIRLINRAKSTLMKYLGFTEPQAHRYLEKQAMNSRCTRREAAKKIISDLT